ncbi:leucine-rich repeat domain-containing protein [Dysgonomonas sp. OttesenSCG-928-M03]|nr:leucine-rich repeat domain-containing protein [Dysgonomonas sp. OttesenSCG-928-M03]
MKIKYLIIFLSLLLGSAQSWAQGLILEDNAFRGSKISQGVVMPDNLISIGTGAFQNASLPCLNFKACVNLEQIKSNAFNNTSLSSYNVLDFSNSAKLKCIETGTSTGSFAGFTGEVILPQEISSRLRRNSLTLVEDNAFKGMKLTDNKTIDLSDSHKLSTMGISAFQNSNLLEVVLPDSLEYIGNNAFSGCVDLSKITSYNPVPPTLGTTVFAGVDTLSCKLRVPEEGLEAYSIADQWKSFLNRNVIGAAEPDEYEKGEEGQVHVWISDDGGIKESMMFQAYDFDTNQLRPDNSGFQGTYKTIGIGEYEYMKENLKAIYRERHNIKFYTYYNWTEDRIKKLSQSYTPYKDETPLNKQEFLTIYGSWFTTQEYARAYIAPLVDYYVRFKDKTDGTMQQGWDLPDINDICQLIGQTPRRSENLNADILNFVGASLSDVPQGHQAEWFDKNKNTSGLTLTPLGTHKNAYDTGVSEELYSSNISSFKTLSKIRLKGGLNHSFSFSQDKSHYSTTDEEFVQVRYVRTKSDEELGYKLYVNTCTDEVVMAPYGGNSVTKEAKTLSESVRIINVKGGRQDIVLRSTRGVNANLVELPKGLERGVALKYVDRSQMTIYKKWSEIVAEGETIREQLANIPAMKPISSGDCFEEGQILRDIAEVGTVIELGFSDEDGKELHFNVTWLSSNPSVGVIENNNSIRLIAEGTTVISVIWEDGYKEDLLLITVTLPKTGGGENPGGGSESDPDPEDGDYTIEFVYDDSGNRVERKVIVLDTRAAQTITEPKVLTEKIANHSVKIYPNPTQGQINIDIDNADSISADVSIFTLNGKLITKDKVQTSGGHLDLSNNPAGIYILKINIDGEVSSWKIIKK